ncbi:MAG: BamA/TamA family outer membrane protein [Pseudomonadota bacterium]|nr:BamA/TamA family outer membrane protein [Pseudomonadota bacterium]
MITLKMPYFRPSPCRGAACCLLAALLALAAAPASADIDVEVTGVDGELQGNVLVYLSVQRYSKRDDIDADTLQRLCDRVDGEVKSALRPLGYYEPQVRATCTPRRNGGQVRIEVTPGEPVRVRELKIAVEGPGADDPVFDGIRNQTLLREGTRLHHGAYERVKGEMTRAADENGYLTARLLDDDARMLVDPQSHTAGIKLVLDTGPRYHFGEVSIDQKVIRPSLMERFVRFNEGEPYNANALLSTQFALDDSLYFSRIDVTPGEPDPETLTVPVTITATKSRPVLSLGGGYGTDTKVRGTATWTDSRVNDRGHRLRFEIKASESTRNVNSRYDIPIGDPALEKLSFELLNDFKELPGYDTNETTLRPAVTRVAGRWQTVTSLSLTRTTTEGEEVDITNNLLVPGLVIASVPENFLGQALFTRGFYSEILASHTSLGAGTNFLSARVRLEKSYNVASQLHLLLRGEVGTTLVDDFDRLDGIYRFLAGGDRSVRGFAFNSLSPRDPVSGEATGGQHLLTASTELVRDLPRNFGVATFFDAGNAFNRFGDKLEYSAGVGLRYRVSVLSLGFDIAKPLSTNGKYRLHLNISPIL